MNRKKPLNNIEGHFPRLIFSGLAHRELAKRLVSKYVFYAIRSYLMDILNKGTSHNIGHFPPWVAHCPTSKKKTTALCRKNGGFQSAVV